MTEERCIVCRGDKTFHILGNTPPPFILKAKFSSDLLTSNIIAEAQMYIYIYIYIYIKHIKYIYI